MKIFITGASSFLGNGLVDRLKDKHEVSVLEHARKLKETEGVKVVHGGLQNISDWENALSDIEVIIHLAGITHSKDLSIYKKINTKGTEDLILSAQKYSVKQLIFISTRAIGEDCGAYGESKRKAEEFLKASNIAYTILRPAEGYDDKFSGNEGLGGFVRLIKRNFIVPYVYSKNLRSAPIHIDDVQMAIINSIENPAALRKTYTLAGPENISQGEIIDRITKKYGLRRFALPTPIQIVGLAFPIISTILKLAPDQFQRLTCQKDPLSQSVLSDLRVTPRKFLK